MRILIDMDGVLYDMNPIWFKLHNEEYGHIHELTPENVTDWYVGNHCKENNCPAEIYKYFQMSQVWNSGDIVDLTSVAVTEAWVNRGFDVAVVTTTPNQIAPNRKLSWLKNNFPHIKDAIITTTGSMKSWIEGDFLIDDRIDNHEGFKGISILYDTPYNQNADLPRARDWLHVLDIVDEGVRLLHNNTFLYMKEQPYKIIQDLLFRMIRNGEL